MDKKKALIIVSLFIATLFVWCRDVSAQTPARLEFFDRAYDYGIGNDTIRVFFNITGPDEKRMSDISAEDFSTLAYFYEDGNQIQNPEITRLSSGVRIPKDFTFSILLDQSIPAQGKQKILESIEKFVEIAPDSCVFISIYGNEVSNSVMVNKDNFDKIKESYLKPSSQKKFYSGILAKLSEFSKSRPSFFEDIKASGYVANTAISRRAAEHPGKNLLMVFAEGSTRPDDENLDFLSMIDYQAENVATLPKVFAFYYTASSDAPAILDTLEGLVQPKDAKGKVVESVRGQVASSSNINDVLSQFQTVIESATYDYQMLYTATPGKTYTGNVEFEASWGRAPIGNATFTIGSPERSWPVYPHSATSFIVELLVAILVAVLTLAFFIVVMKVVVPFIQSQMFKSRYYKKYEPEDNVQRRICHYCKQDLRPGQIIVAKCNHWMHKHCWEENGYKCAEYGQNCNTGIQNHVDMKELFRLSTLKDCSQTIAGVLAGLVSWIIYEICGRGGFGGVARFIVGLVVDEDGAQTSLYGDLVARTSSFLMIGLLLGFFVSLVFRYKDDIRDKDWRIWLKIVGLSLLTGFVGMIAFAIGADLMCLILTWTGSTYIPWYCSLPAYVLFSISVSLALTINSTIPVRSALLGGTVSAVIGFLVLYFSRFAAGKYDWLNMLLAFIIYGGGLGASLVTVRMLAEKYFLVIQNGIKAGQRIPIHKWMNSTGGGNKVSVGMTGECEIQMNWEKSNKVAKVHAQLSIDHEKMLPVIKPLATGVIYNSRAELPVNRSAILSNGDVFKIGDTIFKYEEI